MREKNRYAGKDVERERYSVGPNPNEPAVGIRASLPNVLGIDR